MVSAAWRSLHDEIARWRDAGRSVEFWWRDDDASRRTPALSRLFDLAADADVPLALAIVPECAEHGLLEGVVQGVAALQHGVDHRNRAETDGKKTEFPLGESVDAALARLAAGRAQLESVVGRRALPVLAPPWNRLSAALVPRLAAAGYRGLSTYGARKPAEPAPGLVQVNTHVDVIDWKGGRRFGGEDYVLGQAIRHLASRRAGQIDKSEPTGWLTHHEPTGWLTHHEPTGWLTHHAVHDEAAWNFLARLFEATRGIAGVTWLRPADLFSCEGDK